MKPWFTAIVEARASNRCSDGGLYVRTLAVISEPSRSTISGTELFIVGPRKRAPSDRGVNSNMLHPNCLSRRDALRIGAQGFGLTAAALACPAAAADDDKTASQAVAKSSDVESIEAIIAAVYASISGPAGTRDWNRLRSLFHAGARLLRAAPAKGESSPISLMVFDVEAFVERVKPSVMKEGFFEREVARRVERFGAVAHVFSTYESRHAESDPQPFARGINSIQLFFDSKRWWVVTIYWDSERPGQMIPAEYLPKA
jgi:hypothetical protein